MKISCKIKSQESDRSNQIGVSSNLLKPKSTHTKFKLFWCTCDSSVPAIHEKWDTNLLNESDPKHLNIRNFLIMYCKYFILAIIITLSYWHSEMSRWSTQRLLDLGLSTRKLFRENRQNEEFAPHYVNIMRADLHTFRTFKCNNIGITP